MQAGLAIDRRVFLSTGLAGHREVRIAIAAVLVSAAFFFATAPLATNSVDARTRFHPDL